MGYILTITIQNGEEITWSFKAESDEAATDRAYDLSSTLGCDDGWELLREGGFHVAEWHISNDTP